MAIGASQPFRPAGTAALSATTTSASVALAGGGDSILVTNASNALAFIRFGADPSITARTSDTPLPAGGRLLLGINRLIGFAAGILVSGTGSLYFTRGDGSIY